MSTKLFSKNHILYYQIIFGDGKVWTKKIVHRVGIDYRIKKENLVNR